jgi:MarR family transcriptional regulator, transcriptional regulator for hemolysin
MERMEDLPFEIAETAHAMRRAFDRRAVSLGVTRAQWKVLFRLTRFPGLRQVELAEMLDVEPITLSRIVDRLEEASLVERAPDPADRRAWRLQVTEKAKPLVAKLKALGTELVDEAFEGVEQSDLERVRSVLAQVRENLATVQRGKKAAEA